MERTKYNKDRIYGMNNNIRRGDILNTTFLLNEKSREKKRRRKGIC